MQVLHRQNEGLPPTDGQAELLQGGKHLRLDRTGVMRGQRVSLGRHAQDLQEIWGLVRWRHADRAQIGVEFRGDRLRAIHLSDPTELTQQLLHWQIRRSAGIGQTMPFAVGHRSIVQALGEFVEQS